MEPHYYRSAPRPPAAAPDPMARPRRRLIWLLMIAVVLLVVWQLMLRSAAPANHSQPAGRPAASFNKKQYSLIDPASPWAVVNKLRPLQPVNYVPAELVQPNIPLQLPGAERMLLAKPAADALTQLSLAATAAGAPIMLASGYRSYDYQVQLYNGYVKEQGQSEADAGSARPGYSEHQTGLAADVEPTSGQCAIAACFGTTPAGQWLAANAYRYGFIIRYPSDKTAVTGYEYEPWHIRYVDIPLASEMHRTGIQTLEEFFGLPAAPDYAK